MSSERDLKAEDYPRLYETYYMNDDAPRLSGKDCLVHGYKAGWNTALQSSEVTKLREENRIMREALKQINDEELNSQRPGGGYSKSAALSYEALEKVK
jgi:hypothetical protein